MLKIYTIYGGRVEEGTIVSSLTLKGAGVTIPAILVGEEGRNRKLGVLPVELLPDQYKIWQEKGEVNILAASLGTTKTGKPKLIAASPTAVTVFDKIIVVFRTHIGFRGHNAHTGDQIGEKEEHSLGGVEKYGIYAPFPGEVLVQGQIAQGDAGRMGWGRQLVAVIPKGVIFRTAYSGRLYGDPPEHYYKWDGERLVSMTREERELLNELGG